MQVRKQELELDMEQQTGSKSGKEYIKAVYCHPTYLTYMKRNAGLDEAQGGIKIAGRNINNLWYADDTTLTAESKETKEPLDETERGEWKIWLKLSIQKTKDRGIWSHHFMANRWRNSGNNVSLYCFGLQKSLQMVPAAMKLKDTYSLEEKLWPT